MQYPYATIDKIASDLLKKYNITVPVKIGQFLKKIDNISVIESDSQELKKEKVLGLVSKIGEKKYKIYYLKGEHVTRTRFTVAHELGHIYLGHLNDKDILVDRLHRNENFGGIKNKDNEIIEKEANIFASCFLMPKEEFILKWNALKDIYQIANYFQVSQESAGIRLSELNLLKF